MKRVLLVFGFAIIMVRIYAQLPAGAPAPDFTVLDINGNSVNLYAKMGSKAACLDFSATWCGVCWNFHNSGILKNIYNNLAADATAVFLEADYNTNTNCLYGPSGCIGSTQGDWVTGSPYPIVDLSPSNGPNVKSNYAVTYFPTVYVISPDKRAWEVRTLVYQVFVNWITKSFKLLATGNVTHANCGNNGKIDLNVSGGHGTLEYQWSNGATSKNLNNLPGGSYSVTITDENGYFKAFGPWTVNNPPKQVEISNEEITHVKCFDESNGSIDVEASLGTPPYTFSWSNGHTGKLNQNLAAGDYTLTVSDNAACTITKTYTVLQPTKIAITATTKKEECDEKNGSINVRVIGGTPSYQYDIGFGKQQTSLFSGLEGAKDYIITVTDDNLCVETLKVRVDATHKPVADAGPATNFENCIADSLILDGSKSDKGPSIKYQWTTIDGHILSGDDIQFPSINKTGTYFIMVTDTTTKCTNLDSITVEDHRIYPNIHTSEDTLLNCKLTEIELSGSSDSIPVLYYWKKVGDSSFVEIGQSLMVSDSGLFIFHVQDTLNYCITMDTITISKDQIKPEAIAIPDVSCIHPEVIIDASASTQGLNIIYKWTTTNGNILSGENTSKVLVNAGGEYHLVVENTDNFCTAELRLDLIEQKEPQVSFNQLIDTLRVEFTDQTEGHPTSWAWDFGDINSPNNSSVEQNPIHTFSSIGEYEVCLEVENDCGKDKKCKTIQVGIVPPLQLSSTKIQHVLCFGESNGNIQLVVEGGFPPYTYEWNTSDTTKDIDSLSAGSYTVTITDQQGSILIDSFVLTQPDEISLLEAEITNTESGSQTGRILLKLDGGIEPFNYLWSNGETVNPLDSLKAGEYTCVVTDDNGCTVEFGPFKVDEVTGTKNIKQVNDPILAFNLMPNPVSGKGYIHIQFKTRMPYTVKLITTLGVTVWSESHHNSESFIPVEFSQLSKGVYFVVIQNQTFKRISKWVIK
jgi:hypothetical protein